MCFGISEHGRWCSSIGDCRPVLCGTRCINKTFTHIIGNNRRRRRNEDFLRREPYVSDGVVKRGRKEAAATGVGFLFYSPYPVGMVLTGCVCREQHKTHCVGSVITFYALRASDPWPSAAVHRTQQPPAVARVIFSSHARTHCFPSYPPPQTRQR